MEDTPMLANLLRFDRSQTRWMDRAECLNYPADMFYPEPAGASKTAQARYASEVAEAIQVCDMCPVKDLCLKDAEDRQETHGVWGGQDFRKTRRQQAAESRMAS